MPTCRHVVRYKYHYQVIYILVELNGSKCLFCPNSPLLGDIKHPTSMVWLELTFGALSGNQLVVHNHRTRKLLNTPNTFGWVRNASLSNPRSCHVMD